MKKTWCYDWPLSMFYLNFWSLGTILQQDINDVTDGIDTNSSLFNIIKVLFLSWFSFLVLYNNQWCAIFSLFAGNRWVLYLHCSGQRYVFTGVAALGVQGVWLAFQYLQIFNRCLLGTFFLQIRLELVESLSAVNLHTQHF